MRVRPAITRSTGKTLHSGIEFMELGALKSRMESLRERLGDLRGYL